MRFLVQVMEIYINTKIPCIALPKFSYTVFSRLSAGSPKGVWSRMSTGSKEDIMIAGALKNESQMSTGGTEILKLKSTRELI